MCRSGSLSPGSLIVYPDGSCKKVADTDLAEWFGLDVKSESAPATVGAKGIASKTEYDELRREISGGSADWNRLVQLAELALAFGDRVSAVAHFQEALNANHYHPRIRASANRCLSRAELRKLRYLNRPKPIWEDLGDILMYPLGRGPLYVLIPTAVVWALLWVPVAKIAVPFLLFLWAVEVVRTAAGQRERPPLWHGFREHPIDTLLKPFGVALILAVELYAPFLVLAGILAWVDARNPSLWTVIEKSPIMIVVMSTLTLIYVPAALVVAAGSNGDFRWIADPRRIVAAIAKMEREYVASVGMVAAMIAVWSVLDYLFDFIPFVGRVLTVGAGLYILVAGGMVVGKLQARFQDELE
jgi:hypothetical protein